MIDPAIFQYLQDKAANDVRISEGLYKFNSAIERHVATGQGLLSRIHSTPVAKLAPLLAQIEQDAIKPEIEAVGELAKFASEFPYYKYNHRWTRSMQNIILTILLAGWLGGVRTAQRPGELGRLLTIEEVGEILQVPVNLEDRDAFHITIEEYLLALTDLTEELSRLAMNSVTLGNVALTVRISGFIKDLFAGFQLLNLKNDTLRRKVDGVKYHVKKVEDVIYDLSLRGLIPAEEATRKAEGGTVEDGTVVKMKEAGIVIKMEEMEER